MYAIYAFGTLKLRILFESSWFGGPFFLLIPILILYYGNILVFWGWLCYIYYKVEKEVVKTTKNEDFIHRQ